MKQRLSKERPAAGIICAVVILITGILLGGTAYARYQKHLTVDFPFIVRDPASFQVISESGGWDTVENGQTYGFSVNNMGNSYHSFFTLRIVASLGFRYDGATVSIVVTDAKGNTTTYQAVGEAIYATDPLYETMGEGTQYRFLDGTGKELAWELPGGTQQGLSFHLLVEGAEEPGLIRIVVGETKQPER